MKNKEERGNDCPRIYMPKWRSSPRLLGWKSIIDLKPFQHAFTVGRPDSFKSRRSLLENQATLRAIYRMALPFTLSAPLRVSRDTNNAKGNPSCIFRELCKLSKDLQISQDGNISARLIQVIGLATATRKINQVGQSMQSKILKISSSEKV